ncbi:uncharacterized protein LOC129583981 [Paramacrobiotus metropolitanus]|uniref:uncharacterized protein LOC129583981 n=1 Tax=Paramacrobiotus metropolitanus TaxID=2943436 RepID=UPI002445E6F8|nr:uncharacterized protein LOC129583981 [Paramacrobiotus metropolitanus]
MLQRGFLLHLGITFLALHQCLAVPNDPAAKSPNGQEPRAGPQAGSGGAPQSNSPTTSLFATTFNVSPNGRVSGLMANMGAPFPQRLLPPNRPGPQLGLSGALPGAAQGAAGGKNAMPDASALIQARQMQNDFVQMNNMMNPMMNPMLQGRNFPPMPPGMPFGAMPQRMPTDPAGAGAGADTSAANNMNMFNRMPGGGFPTGRQDLGAAAAFGAAAMASQYRPVVSPTGASYMEGLMPQYRRPIAGNEIPESRGMYPGSYPGYGGYDKYSAYSKPAQAVVIVTGPYGVSGLVNLTQYSPDAPVELSGRIGGVRPGDHGFHVHTFGDLSMGCESAGSHFNPEGNYHGSPDDAHMQPHAGDLGNVRANEYGEVIVTVSSPLISLYPQSPSFVIGRTLVIHEKPDDLGRGGDQQSRETGNSGARIGCGIIGFGPAASY